MYRLGGSLPGEGGYTALALTTVAIKLNCLFEYIKKIHRISCILY